MYVYAETTNEIETIFSPPQGGLKTNEIEHHKVLYFDFLLLSRNIKVLRRGYSRDYT